MMASKERYTVDDIIQELEMGVEFEGESDDDFEGYLDEEMQKTAVVRRPHLRKRAA